MTQKDLGQVKSAMMEAMQPIHDEIIKHRQTLYGPNGDNGLCGDTKKLRKELDVLSTDYQVYKGKLAVIGGMGAAIFGTVGGFVSKLIKIGG